MKYEASNKRVYKKYNNKMLHSNPIKIKYFIMNIKKYEIYEYTHVE